MYYNKEFFYSKGYKIEIRNDKTKENLVDSGAVVLEEKTDNYINIKGTKLLPNKTKVRIVFKAL